MSANIFKVKVLSFEKLLYLMESHGFKPFYDKNGEFNANNNYIEENELDKALFNKSQYTNLFEENGLFYQIAMEKGITLTNDKKKFNELKDLVYIDFSEISSFKGHESYIACLFRNGFFVNKGEKTLYHYMPFDKSASMGRQSRISFLNDIIGYDKDNQLIEGFFKKIANRAYLGLLDEEVKGVPLAKRYAYRGLLLSSGKRITNNDIINGGLYDFKFDKSRVLIVPDYILSSPKVTYLTQEAKKEQSDENLVDFGTEPVQKTETREITFNDGYGFISNELANAIDECFKEKKKHQSYQIRLPFVKGMVHRIDYRAFIYEHYSKDIVLRVFNDNLEMEKRTFTIEEIEKVELIISESMFKCFKELKQFDVKKCFDDNDKPFTSKLDYYFYMLNKYEHSLFVLTVDKPDNEVEKYTTTNYQFLSTVDLSTLEFDKIYDKDKDNYIKFKTDKQKQIDYFLKNKDLNSFDDNKIDDEESSINKNNDRYEIERKLLEINNDFIAEPRYKDILTDVATSRREEMSIGRLSIKGSDRFLLSDPLTYLYYLIGKEIPDDKKISVNSIMAPGSDENWKNKKIAVLRNPHLSRNEDLVLKLFIPEENSEREIYLNNLTGCAIINPNDKSLPAETISGADFDGDHVKLFFDKTYVNAINKHKNKGNLDSYPLVINKDYVNSFKNREEKNQDQYKDNWQNKCDVNKNTFSNNVGQISNMAFREGLHGYSKKSKESNEDIEKHKNLVRLLGILTGVEVDSCKTGLKPKYKSLSITEKKSKTTNCIKVGDKVYKNGDNFFINFKNVSKGTTTKKEIKDKLGEATYNQIYEESDYNTFKDNFLNLVGRFPSNVETLIQKDNAIKGRIKVNDNSSKIKVNPNVIPFAPAKVKENKDDKGSYIYKGSLYFYIESIIKAYNKICTIRNAENYKSGFKGKNIGTIYQKVGHTEKGQENIENLIQYLSNTENISYSKFIILTRNLSTKNLVYNYYPLFSSPEGVNKPIDKARKWLEKQFKDCGVTLGSEQYKLLMIDEKLVDLVIQNVKERRDKQYGTNFDVDTKDKLKSELIDKELDENSASDFLEAIDKSFDNILEEANKLLNEGNEQIFYSFSKTKYNKFTKVLLKVVNSLYYQEVKDIDTFSKKVKERMQFLCDKNNKGSFNEIVMDEVEGITFWSHLEKLSDKIIEYSVSSLYEKYFHKKCENEAFIIKVNKYRNINKKDIKVLSRYAEFKTAVEQRSNEDWHQVLKEITIAEMKRMIQEMDKKNWDESSLNREMIRYVRALQKEADKNQKFLFDCLGEILLKEMMKEKGVVQND